MEATLIARKQDREPGPVTPNMFSAGQTSVPIHRYKLKGLWDLLSRFYSEIQMTERISAENGIV